MLRDIAHERKPELEVGVEPAPLELVAARAEIPEYVAEILRDEVRQHETIVKLRSHPMPAVCSMSRILQAWPFAPSLFKY